MLPAKREFGDLAEPIDKHLRGSGRGRTIADIATITSTSIGDTAALKSARWEVKWLERQWAP